VNTANINPKPKTIIACLLQAFLLMLLLSLATITTARAQNLSATSNFIDTTTQTPTLCVQFNEPLSPSLAAHYEDYVRVDQYTGLVTEVSGANLCIGGLPYAKTYHLTLLPGLPAQDGDTLPSATSFTYSPAGRPALVAIAGNGLYLAKRSATGLPITTVNVKRLVIHILRLNDVNAIQDFSTISGTQTFDPTQQTFQGYTLANLIAGQASVIWSGTMPVGPNPDQNVDTIFPIATALGQSADIMAAKPGIYLVTAEDAATAVPPGFWNGTLPDADQSDFNSVNFATHWVVVTDLGVTAVTGDDGLHATIRSISTAAPAANVKLNLISTGGDILTSVTTNTAGQATIPAAQLAGHLANTPLALAAYAPDGDFSYLPLATAAFDLSDRGVTGRPAPVTNDAFIAADRGIYRPGETVHALVLLRDADGKALPNQPITLGLIRPDTVQVTSIQAVTDDAGGTVIPIPLPANAFHGQWVIQASIDPTLLPIGSLTIDVENFQPADMRIEATGAPNRAAPGSTIHLAATGTYLYGAPAILPVRATATITKDPNPIPGLTGYQFGLLNDQPADAETDLTPPPQAGPDGKIAFDATIPTPSPTTQPLRAKIVVGYLEPSGNLTTDTQFVKLTTTPDLIGIKPAFTGGSVDSGSPAAFSIAAFDPTTAKPIATTLQLRLVRTDTIYDWVGTSNSWTWHSYTVDHPVELTSLAPAGDTPTDFARSLPDGDYTLIAADPKTGAATSIAFSVGWSGLGTTASTPDILHLSADHTTLSPGGTAKIHIEGSFAGTADIVVANNRVYAERTVDVPKSGADISITATPDWNGGAYVIADLHRGANDAPGHASVRAIGVGWIGLDPTPHTLAVTIQSPTQILPRTHQTITVKIANAARGAKIHLVLNVTDEGILGLTKYTTPDPVSWFWGQRRLGVEIRDIYGNLLNDQGQPGSITEGGDEGAGGPRVPLQSTRLFATASADLAVGQDGTIQIPLDVPDFEGQARLTAIAWTATQSGSVSTDMIIRDPIVMNPGLPNFLSTGDLALLPLSLANEDGPAGTYAISLALSDATLKTPIQKVTLSKSQQFTIAFPFTAGPPGLAPLEFHLTGNGQNITRSFSIPIRPAHPPSFLALTGAAKPGAAILIPAAVKNAGAQTGTATLSASTFPGLDPAFLLATLARDNSDTETVTSISRVFPLLAPAYAAQYKGGAPAARTAIDAVITLIANREGFDGDIGDYSFSAGDDGFNDWISSYGVDFLLSAQAAGYSVPAVVLDRAKLWLRTEAPSLAQVITYQGNAYGSEAPAPFSSFVYTQWLLTRIGHPNIGALRIATDALVTARAPDGFPLVFWGNTKSPGNLTASGDLAKLSMALYAAGDAARAATVLNLAASTLTTPGQPSWADSFWWTSNQDAAILLYAAATEQNETIFTLAAKHIDPATLTENDDDDAIAFLLRATAASDAASTATNHVFSVALGAKTVHIPVPGSTDLPWPSLLRTGTIKIISGQGYYDLAATYTPTAPTTAYAQGMTLTVTMKDLHGKPLDPANLHQGGDAVISIFGTAPRDTTHLMQIVALTPGCFTIEKSMPGPNDVPAFPHISSTESVTSEIDRFIATVRLGTAAWNAGNSDSDTPDPTAMPAGQFLVVYIAKITTAGTFTFPEVTVRDRLHPAISAASASRILTVTK
jgi:uncharacterized protein YfaS (alpha-2-macroglobulin family)